MIGRAALSSRILGVSLLAGCVSLLVGCRRALPDGPEPAAASAGTPDERVALAGIPLKSLLPASETPTTVALLADMPAKVEEFRFTFRKK